MAERSKLDGGFWITTGIAVVLIAVNIPLVGIPGTVVFIAGDQLAMLIFGELHGDYYWPIGFVMGFVWSPGIPIAYLVARRTNIPATSPLPKVAFRVSIFLGVLYAWIAIFSTAFHVYSLK